MASGAWSARSSRCCVTGHSSRTRCSPPCPPWSNRRGSATHPCSAAADALTPLVERRGTAYARSGIEEAVLPERWIGGVRVSARRVRIG